MWGDYRLLSGMTAFDEGPSRSETLVLRPSPLRPLQRPSTRRRKPFVRVLEYRRLPSPSTATPSSSASSLTSATERDRDSASFSSLTNASRDSTGTITTTTQRSASDSASTLVSSEDDDAVSTTTPTNQRRSPLRRRRVHRWSPATFRDRAFDSSVTSFPFESTEDDFRPAHWGPPHQKTGARPPKIRLSMAAESSRRYASPADSATDSVAFSMPSAARRYGHAPVKGDAYRRAVGAASVSNGAYGRPTVSFTDPKKASTFEPASKALFWSASMMAPLGSAAPQDPPKILEEPDEEEEDSQEMKWEQEEEDLGEEEKTLKLSIESDRRRASLEPTQVTEILDVISSDLIDHLVNQNSDVIPEELVDDFNKLQGYRHVLDEESLERFDDAVKRKDWDGIVEGLQIVKENGSFASEAERRFLEAVLDDAGSVASKTLPSVLPRLSRAALEEIRHHPSTAPPTRDACRRLSRQYEERDKRSKVEYNRLLRTGSMSHLKSAIKEMHAGVWQVELNEMKLVELQWLKRFLSEEHPDRPTAAELLRTTMAFPASESFLRSLLEMGTTATRRNGRDWGGAGGEEEAAMEGDDFLMPEVLNLMNQKKRRGAEREEWEEWDEWGEDERNYEEEEKISKEEKEERVKGNADAEAFFLPTHSDHGLSQEHTPAIRSNETVNADFSSSDGSAVVAAKMADAATDAATDADFHVGVKFSKWTMTDGEVRTASSTESGTDTISRGTGTSDSYRLHRGRDALRTALNRRDEDAERLRRWLRKAMDAGDAVGVKSALMEARILGVDMPEDELEVLTRLLVADETTRRLKELGFDDYAEGDDGGDDDDEEDNDNFNGDVEKWEIEDASVDTVDAVDDLTKTSKMTRQETLRKESCHITKLLQEIAQLVAAKAEHPIGEEESTRRLMDAGIDGEVLRRILEAEEKDRREARTRVSEAFDSGILEVAVDALAKFQSKLTAKELESFASKLVDIMTADTTTRPTESTNWQLISTLWTISVDTLQWVEDRAKSKEVERELHIEGPLENVMEPLSRIAERLRRKRDFVLEALGDNLPATADEDVGKEIENARHLGLNAKNPTVRIAEVALLSRGLQAGFDSFIEALEIASVRVAERYLESHPPPFNAEQLRRVDDLMRRKRHAEADAIEDLEAAVEMRNVAFLKEAISTCRKIGSICSTLRTAEKALVKAAAEKHLRVRGRNKTPIDREERLRKIFTSMPFTAVDYAKELSVRYTDPDLTKVLTAELSRKALVRAEIDAKLEAAIVNGGVEVFHDAFRVVRREGFAADDLVDFNYAEELYSKSSDKLEDASKLEPHLDLLSVRSLKRAQLRADKEETKHLIDEKIDGLLEKKRKAFHALEVATLDKDVDALQLAIHKCLAARLHGADVRIQRGVQALLEAIDRETRTFDRGSRPGSWDLSHLDPLVLKLVHQKLLKSNVQELQDVLRTVDEARDRSTEMRESTREGLKTALEFENLEGILTSFKLVEPKTDSEDAALAGQALDALLRIFEARVRRSSIEAAGHVEKFERFAALVDAAPTYSTLLTDAVDRRRRFRDELFDALGEERRESDAELNEKKSTTSSPPMNWGLFRMLERAESELSVDSGMVSELKRVSVVFGKGGKGGGGGGGGIGGDGGRGARRLLDHVTLASLVRATGDESISEEDRRRLQRVVKSARERDRRVLTRLSTAEDDERLTAALVDAKKVGFFLQQESRREIAAREREIIRRGSEGGKSSTTTTTTIISPNDHCSLESHRAAFDDDGTASNSLFFSLRQRDEIAKGRLTMALELGDPKSLESAAEQFKVIGLCSEDGPIEEAEAALIDAFLKETDETLEREGRADGQPSRRRPGRPSGRRRERRGDLDDLLQLTDHGTLLGSETRLSPEVRAKMDKADRERSERQRACIQDAKRAVKTDDAEALKDAVEELKRIVSTPTVVGEENQGGVDVTSLLSILESLVLVNCLIEEGFVAFKNRTVAARCKTLASIDQQLQKMKPKQLRKYRDSLKRQALEAAGSDEEEEEAVEGTPERSESLEELLNDELLREQKENVPFDPVDEDEEDGAIEVQDIDDANDNDKADTESVYSCFYWSRDSAEPEPLGQINLSANSADHRLQLRSHILAAIKEEDLRLLHQLVDICDVCGITKNEFPALVEADHAIHNLVHRSKQADKQGHRKWIQNQKASDELELTSRRLRDQKQRAKFLFKAALLSGDPEKIEKALARLKFHGIDDDDEVKQALEYLRLLTCKAESERAVSRFDVDTLDRELFRARNRNFAAFEAPFLPPKFFWGFFIGMENLLGQWLTLRNVYHDLEIISIKEISEVCSYTKPPHCTELVLRSFLLLLGQTAKSLATWDKIKQLLKMKMGLVARRELSQIKAQDIDPVCSLSALRCLSGVDRKDVLHSSRPLVVFYRFTKSLAHQATELSVGRASEGDGALNAGVVFKGALESAGVVNDHSAAQNSRKSSSADLGSRRSTTPSVVTNRKRSGDRTTAPSEPRLKETESKRDSRMTRTVPPGRRNIPPR